MQAGGLLGADHDGEEVRISDVYHGFCCLGGFCCCLILLLRVDSAVAVDSESVVSVLAYSHEFRHSAMACTVMDSATQPWTVSGLHCHGFCHSALYLCHTTLKVRVSALAWTTTPWTLPSNRVRCSFSDSN
jgi:hypothetical protein